MFRSLFTLVFVTFIFLTVLTVVPSVKADGLDEALSTLKHLNAPPPPVVEDPLPLLPTEPEEAVVEVPVTKKNIWPMVSQGMILEKPSPEGKITASEDQKQMLTQGDIVYLSSFGEPFDSGQEWLVFKTMKDVHHPKSGAYLGELVHVLGIAKVIKVNNDVATARLTRSKEPIAIGNKIAFIDRFMPPITETTPPPEGGSLGVIVEVHDDRLNVAQNDIVYIDYGSEEGIDEGDRFVVVHAGERDALASTLRKTELPDRNIGLMVVLATQAHTATAKITQSIEPIAKGDTILYRPEE